MERVEFPSLQALTKWNTRQEAEVNSLSHTDAVHSLPAHRAPNPMWSQFQNAELWFQLRFLSNGWDFLIVALHTLKRSLYGLLPFFDFAPHFSLSLVLQWIRLHCVWHWLSRVMWPIYSDICGKSARVNHNYCHNCIVVSRWGIKQK